MHADAGPHGRQQNPHPKAAQGFETPVTVGVILVGRIGGDPQAQVDQAGGQNVGRGFDAIGNRSHRVRCEPDADLRPDLAEPQSRRDACSHRK